ncbi:MAG: monovalent cation/H(+) antiporter subunit G [Spirochaetales bacterium]|nr:monovalent cation/H(+) antiporter subunit G [Spirochaetales bacterium]
MTGVVLALILLLVAAMFGTAGILGLFRFRDPLVRLHAGSLASTTAVFSIFLELLVGNPDCGTFGCHHVR